MFLPGNPDVLLIGGHANEDTGLLYQVGVVRDVDGHVTGLQRPRFGLRRCGLQRRRRPEVDANGDPIVATRRDFMTDTTAFDTGPEGAVLDPVTGDFLFSTFTDQAESRVIVVKGFNTPVPESSTFVLLGLGLAQLARSRRRA